ncbi:MAG: Hsp20/alpha crystallin family protein [Proteobacteria bacterium]|nr:Hsp20/alpha crystallin family protein [Pseudomonadota bacterium]MCH8263547.1 Hsp20/alpha crystallin family protein [Pseudomonadota bacterium]
MALVRYEPWNLLDRLQREFNLQNLLDPYAREVEGEDNSNVVTSHWRPAVDIKEEEDRFVIYADLPGVDPEDIEITMEQGVLTLKGERSEETTKEREGYKRVERVNGSFYRRFSLPDIADAERIEAKGKNGVLEITLPKQEKAKPKRITVKS